MFFFCSATQRASGISIDPGPTSLTDTPVLHIAHEHTGRDSRGPELLTEARRTVEIAPL